MELTQVQQDALIELLNIGFGRAAASLSQLTGHRVVLEVPEVSVHPISELSSALRVVVADQIASVHQIFSGPVAGDALLILDHQAAGLLKELLTDEPALPLKFDASGREVLTEVGNILLNACLGSFGNLLHVRVSFAVPRLSLDTLHGVLESLTVEREGMRYALVVHAGFRLRDAEVVLRFVLRLARNEVAFREVHGTVVLALRELQVGAALLHLGSVDRGSAAAPPAQPARGTRHDRPARCCSSRRARSRPTADCRRDRCRSPGPRASAREYRKTSNCR